MYFIDTTLPIENFQEPPFEEYKGYDIEEIIKNSIPEHLQDKFNQLLNEMNDQSI